MKNQSVLDALSQLSDSIKLTFQLISRLSKLSFQPGSTPLQGDGDVRIELSHDIRDALKHHDDTLDSLRHEVEDVVEFGTHSSRRRDSLKDRETARIAAQLARLDEDLKQYVQSDSRPTHHSFTKQPHSARSQFRAAQLSSKRASEAAKQKEREILFASLQQPTEPVTEKYASLEDISYIVGSAWCSEAVINLLDAIIVHANPTAKAYYQQSSEVSYRVPTADPRGDLQAHVDSIVQRLRVDVQTCRETPPTNTWFCSGMLGGTREVMFAINSNNKHWVSVRIYICGQVCVYNSSKRVDVLKCIRQILDRSLAFHRVPERRRRGKVYRP